MKNITALILAGGRGSRMGSVDKGLQIFQGKPMVAHVIARLAPQVDEIIINANRSLDEYQAFGHRVISDAIDGFAGPLAGLHVGMMHATHRLIVTAPCDSPFLPLDLAPRLHTALIKENADLAVAKTFDQAQPVFCLVKKEKEAHLRAFLETGQRKIDKWYETLQMVEVKFDDQEAAFANINTLDDLRALDNMQTKPAP
jgi:molybdopterin-guanine dinucleotide biosynthesis protein A